MSGITAYILMAVVFAADGGVAQVQMHDHRTLDGCEKSKTALEAAMAARGADNAYIVCYRST